MGTYFHNAVIAAWALRYVLAFLLVLLSAVLWADERDYRKRTGR